MSAAAVLPLAEKYRPKRFDDIVAQAEAVRILGDLVRQESPPPVLLYGPPGTGKTSLARIFASARHCAAPSPSPCGGCADCKGGLTPWHWYDFSGSRWDDSDVAKFVETLLSTVPWNKYGVFIDEVHGLQPKAADVLLAEVERPRKGRFFICATTELESVRPALRSRCITIPLQLVPKAELFSLAQRICGSENIPYEVGALDILVSQARGSARELVMALDGVATRGHLTPTLLKSALSLGWTDQLIAYFDALLAGDLEQQFEAITNWCAPPRDKARAIKEFLLFLFNFEASSPRLRDHVNAAFHLVGPTERGRLAAAFNLRARAEGLAIHDYWQQLMGFWLFEPSLVSDEASLAIKLHQFHRLVTPIEGPILVSPITGEAAPRKREFRSRSTKLTAASPTGNAGTYLAHKSVERLAESVSFLGQHHGLLVNVAMDILVTAPADTVEGAMSAAITNVTHELGLRIQDWAGAGGDRQYHWLYRNHRSGGTMGCLLALHVPYEHMDAAERWLSEKKWTIPDAEVVVTAEFWNPQPRNTKARDISRLRFQWKRMRELWAALDPSRGHWAKGDTRKPLRELLGLKGEAQSGEPMSIKVVGVSHSLDRGARTAAEKNKMKLLSAFKDAAWAHLDTGWELLEYRDRMTEIAERDDQIRRVEYIGSDSSSLSKKRYSEELEALRQQWPDDPRQRPRTWTPWWAE